mmetsp:Transcript_15986/g.29080  ORF Transcript_15986/g.29080 Transcript_15986/m.29080 type:complete len:238 (+) Transcript_15986:109-822(+)
MPRLVLPVLVASCGSIHALLHCVGSSSIVSAFSVGILSKSAKRPYCFSLFESSPFTSLDSRENNPGHAVGDEHEDDGDIWLTLSERLAGAGVPRSDLRPEDMPSLLMRALWNNHEPNENSGLKSMWEFAGGHTKHIFQQNITEFVESAHETANTLPTSFYGVAMYGKEWSIETPLNYIGGNPETSWIATQVVKTICSDGRVRRWQWELRKNRRPPCLGCWMVETIASSDRKGNFEPE